MHFFFIKVFDFFSKRKTAGLLSLLIFLGAIIYFASKVTFNESVSKIFPKDKELNYINDLLSNSKFLDKFIITINYTDSSKIMPDTLIDVAKILTDSISNRFIPKYIASVEGQTDGSEYVEIFNLFYENLPLYSNQADYNRIDSLLVVGFDSLVYRNLKQLMSPLGYATKDFLIKDPLALASAKLSLLRGLKLDENIDIEDNVFITKNRKNCLLFMQPTNASDTKLNQEFLDSLDLLISSISAQTGNQLEIQYYGSIAVACENAKQLKTDIIKTSSIAVAILSIFIFFFLRGKRAVLLIFLPVGVGLVVGLAYFGIFTDGISAISLGIASVLMGITVDYTIHILTHLKYHGSIRMVLKDITGPILISSITTISAFLCLLFISSEAMQDLGVFAAISIIASAVFALLVLPHFAKRKFKDKPVNSTFIDALAAINFEKNKTFIAIFSIVALVVMYFAQYARFDSDIENANYMSDKLRKADAHIKELTDVSFRSVYIMGLGDNLDKALTASGTVQDSLRYLEQNNIIEGYYGIDTFLITEQKQKDKIAQWNAFWTNNKKQLFKSKIIESGLKYNFKAEAFSQFFAVLDAQYVPIPVDSLASKIAFITSDFIVDVHGQKAVINLAKVKSDKEKAVLYSLLQNNNDVYVVDKKLVATKLFELLKRDFNDLLNYSTLITFLIIFLFLGRIELTVTTLFPMILSMWIILGFMGIFSVPFNVFNIIITSFVFGLGIDYSIFINKGLQQEYIYGRSDLASFKSSVLMSSVTTLVGLGALIFAQHPALKSIAVLSIIGNLTVVIVAFTIQPLLFRFFLYSKDGSRAKAPLSIWTILFSLMSNIYMYVFAITIFLSIPIVYLIPCKHVYRKRIVKTMLCYHCKVIVFLIFHVKRSYKGFDNQIFKTPSIIIANHQSMLDILLMLAMNPNITFVVKDWVWKFPVVGQVARFFGYLNVDKGSGDIAPLILKSIEEGCSVVIFPEGTRSRDGKIKRFHKGAFYLATEYSIPIRPILIHGAAEVNPKGSYYYASGHVTISYLPLIDVNSGIYSSDYSNLTKEVLNYFRQEFDKENNLKQLQGFRKYQLLNNYKYKGPIIENYIKVKVRMENYYTFFENYIPQNAKIYDIGCGMGMLDYMLWLNDNSRTIIGVDYDLDKITLANNTALKNENVQFYHTDALEFEYQQADVFLFNDMLHYLPDDLKTALLTKCCNCLVDNGMILIRDGNTELKSKHEKTKFTEFLSTNIGFNKTKYDLSFLSESFVRDFAQANKLEMELIHSSKVLSNQVFLLTRRKL
ncbi:MAG: 1-acyl-sn-glycerol-3-phosphate acyltransferase [Bacteroidales bacterium]|nr:1-acyl-sn-glycerol-3-phosphate acyltransferase [Bacteroidales bacterium]